MNGGMSGLNALIKNFPLFQSMNEEEVEGLCASVEEQTYERGQKIISQGDAADSFYVLRSGRAIATIDLEHQPSPGKQSSTIVAHYATHEFFGVLGLLADQPHVANVVASSSHAVCLRVQPKDRSSLYALKIVLRGIAVPTPEGFDIRRPGNSMTEGLVTFRDADFENKKATDRQKWVKDAEKAARKKVSQLAGNPKWEYLMEYMPKNLCSQEELERRRWLQNYARAPSLGVENLLGGASKRVIGVLAKALQLNEYPPNQTLVTESTVPTQFFVLFEGEVAVLDAVVGTHDFVTDEDKTEIVSITQPGICFGEGALESFPASNSIRTKTPVAAYTLDPMVFHAVLDSDPESKKTFQKQQLARSSSRSSLVPDADVEAARPRASPRVVQSPSLDSFIASKGVSSMKFDGLEEQHKERYMTPGMPTKRTTSVVPSPPAAEGVGTPREPASLRPPVHKGCSLHCHDSSVFNPINHEGTLKNWESLDFEEEQDFVAMEVKDGDGDSPAPAHEGHTEAQAWFLSLLIGLGTGIFGFLLAIMVSFLTNEKWDFVFSKTSGENGAAGSSADLWTGYGCLLIFTVPMSFMAAVFVYIEPEAAGSGIPNVKVFLNGCALRGLGALGMRTLFLKSIGVGLCVCCGFPAGREGPMVQTGAIIASQLARGFKPSDQDIHIEDEKGKGAMPWYRRLMKTLGIDGTMGSHQLHRDFVSMGCAAGVSAAFIAPIGGVLFSIEEVASYWSDTLTWRTFVCSAVASTTVSLCFGVFADSFSDKGHVLFNQGADGASDYEIWEVGACMLMSAGVGAFGAVFVMANHKMSLIRMTIGSKIRAAHAKGSCCISPAMFKLIEAVVTIWLVCTIFYWVPVAFECSPRPSGTMSTMNISTVAVADDIRRRLSPGVSDDAAAYGISDTAHFPLNLIRFHCKEDEYSQLATLFMNPQEGAIIQMYSRGTVGIFEMYQVAIFAILYFLTTCFVYGIGVPAGLFIPSMMSGAAMGRLYGEILVHWLGEDSTDPGLYSLCGAAAMLGGVTRMTISLAAIMLELTNDITLALPIVLSLVVSKAVGDLMTESIYEVHVELMGAPFLDHEPPESFEKLTAMNVMAYDVKTTLVKASLPEILAMLQTTHHAFPVVQSKESGQFVGMVTRQRLLDMMNVNVKSRSLQSLVDLAKYLEPAPFVVQEQLSLRRTYRLFCNMGMRHLVVLDSLGAVAGIITRKDFLNLPTKVEEVTTNLSASTKKFRKYSQIARHSIASRRAQRKRRHSLSAIDYKPAVKIQAKQKMKGVVKTLVRLNTLQRLKGIAAEMDKKTGLESQPEPEEPRP
jgi:chloride channel 7